MGDRFLTRKATKLRRQSQQCKVFELKIDHSKLSKETLAHLNKLFIEAKWFYNYCLSQENINNADPKVTNVPVKVGDEFEQRDLIYLRSHMKQGLKVRVFNSCRSLKSLKKNGRRIGRLKFKKSVHSIMLQEYKRTFDLNFQSKRIRIQGLQSWLRVSGMEQITPEMEIANAHLVKKSSGFYLHVTTYQNKEFRTIPNQVIGIDFGCQSQLTLSDGTKIEYQISPSKRLKRLDRKIQKNNRKDSKNKRKDQAKRRKLYEHLTNKKHDIRNKIVSILTINYKYICFQNENIHAWHSGGHGKKIQHSGIGAILSDLKHKTDTPIEIDRFFPSTKICPQCKSLTSLPLSDRIYRCEHCGFVKDRDVKSAECILMEGIKRVPTDYREYKPEENLSSACFNLLSNINGIRVSKMSLMSQEAARLALQ